MKPAVEYTLVALATFSVGMIVGVSLRVPPLERGEIICLGSTVSVKNIDFKNVAYTTSDEADLVTAIASAVCNRAVRTTALQNKSGAS